MAERARTRLLVAGEAAARPAGLVAALERAGLLVDEVPAGSDLEAEAEKRTPDAVLLCVAGASESDLTQVRHLRQAVQQWSELPVLAVPASGGDLAVAALLGGGADDAVAAPLDVGVVRARLDRLLALREERRELRATLRARELLFDIFQEVSAAFRAEEIFQTLVQRVGSVTPIS